MHARLVEIVSKDMHINDLHQWGVSVVKNVGTGTTGWERCYWIKQMSGITRSKTFMPSKAMGHVRQINHRTSRNS